LSSTLGVLRSISSAYILSDRKLFFFNFLFVVFCYGYIFCMLWSSFHFGLIIYSSSDKKETFVDRAFYILQLGGPDNVAEMTGRRGMLVRATSGKGVTYLPRNS
jgi:hypothetical protein